jgi:hypothetical protein
MQDTLKRSTHEYDYIVVGVYILFDSGSNCTHALLNVPPEQTASLVVTTRLFEQSSVSANLYKDSLSDFPLRLSPFSLTFPGARGHVRDD